VGQLAEYGIGWMTDLQSKLTAINFRQAEIKINWPSTRLELILQIWLDLDNNNCIVSIFYTTFYNKPGQPAPEMIKQPKS